MENSPQVKSGRSEQQELSPFEFQCKTVINLNTEKDKTNKQNKTKKHYIIALYFLEYAHFTSLIAYTYMESLPTTMIKAQVHKHEKKGIR